MITKVKWRNHSVLGDLELDFTKAIGTPYNTIVLAGENGTGKTSILETLATFLNLGSFEPFDRWRVKLSDKGRKRSLYKGLCFQPYKLLPF